MSTSKTFYYTTTQLVVLHKLFLNLTFSHITLLSSKNCSNVCYKKPLLLLQFAITNAKRGLINFYDIKTKSTKLLRDSHVDTITNNIKTYVFLRVIVVHMSKLYMLMHLICLVSFGICTAICYLLYNNKQVKFIFVYMFIFIGATRYLTCYILKRF